MGWITKYVPTTFASSNGLHGIREYYDRQSIGYWPEDPDPHWANVALMCRADQGQGQDDLLTQRFQIYGTMANTGAIYCWRALQAGGVRLVSAATGHVNGPYANVTSCIGAPNSITNFGLQITSPGITQLALGTADFTMEWWQFTIANTNANVLDFRPSGGAFNLPTWYTTATGSFRYFVNNVDRIAGGNNIVTSQWNHFAHTRASGVSKIWLNGVQQGLNYADTHNFIAPSQLILGNGAAAGAITGYIGPHRFTPGVARWNAAFTPPAVIFPAL